MSENTMHVGPVIAVTELEPTPGGWLLHGADGTVIYLLPGISDAGMASWPLASFRVDDARTAQC